MAITIEDIEALRRKITELPRHQARQVSKQEAITLLATELGAARRRGYSPDELAQLMSEQGVAINAATLRGYLRRNRRSRKPRGGAKAAAGAKAASPAQPSWSESTPITVSPPAPPAATPRSTSIGAKGSAPPSAKEGPDARGTKDAPSTGR